MMLDQMMQRALDYAANAVQYWNIERIVASFENRYSETETDPEEVCARVFTLTMA
jgi:hypothetical protein